MAGRPKIVIPYDLCKELISIHCTQEEIANITGISVRTLQRDEEFCRIYKQGIDSAKMSLRRMQWKQAKSGNVTMLLWLGKQYLGQRDKQDLNANVNTTKLDTLLDQFNDTDKED